MFDALNAREFDRIPALVTADFVDHGAPPGLVPPGPGGYAAVLRWVGETLRITYQLEDVFSVGDRVAIRATAFGVHVSDHLGVPATGKPYSMATAHFYRAEGDLLAEHWGVRDEWGALVQVGALTAAPPRELIARLAELRPQPIG